MTLNKTEKENLVIELLNKGLNIKQISKQAHVSFTDIANIKRKVTGEVDGKYDNSRSKPLSLQSRSFQKFLEGKTLVDVAIELDSTTQEVMDIFSDYLILKNMH